MLHCILDSYLQTVLCMHVYTFDVYSYTITYLLANIIVIVYNRNVYNMLLVICNSECVLTFVGNKEMNEICLLYTSPSPRD